jgi:uncharacterized membrane-anchored protein
VNLRALLFAALVAIQLAAPAWLIVSRENVLRHGTLHKFQTQAVDPADLFRGRYVALNFAAENAPVEVSTNLPYGMPVYIQVAPGADGYSTVTAVTTNRPGSGDWFSGVYQGSGWGTNSRSVRVEFPFNRFYMDENLAPEAERAYNRLNRDRATNINTFATVRILHGRAVLEDLHLDGVPVRTYLRENAPPSAR